MQQSKETAEKQNNWHLNDPRDFWENILWQKVELLEKFVSSHIWYKTNKKHVTNTVFFLLLLLFFLKKKDHINIKT